jgi:hypothetical protein
MLRAIARLNKAIFKARAREKSSPGCAERRESCVQPNERTPSFCNTQQAEEVSLQAAFIYKVPRMRLEFVFTLAQRRGWFITLLAQRDITRVGW